MSHRKRVAPPVSEGIQLPTSSSPAFCPLLQFLNFFSHRPDPQVSATEAAPPSPSPQRSHCECFLLILVHLVLGTNPDMTNASKGAPWGAASWQTPSRGKNDVPLRTDAPDLQSEVYGFPARVLKALPTPLLPLANSLSLARPACHLLCQPKPFSFFSSSSWPQA